MKLAGIKSLRDKARTIPQRSLFRKYPAFKGPHANDFSSLQELQQRLLAFQSHYERSASPFNWTFTRRDLNTLLAKIAVKHLAPAA
jgi:hypothetical protein